jgi:hypothetical protein
MRSQDEMPLLTVAQELIEVSRLADNDDVAAVLHRFTDRVVRLVPGCDHAAVTVRAVPGPNTDPRVAPVAGETVAGADGVVLRPAPLRQSLTDLGPIGEALRHLEPRRLDDARTDQRWPAFSARLVHAGYRSLLALPLPTRRCPPAVLTLLSAQPDPFTHTCHDIALLLTLHAGVVFDNAQLFHQNRQLIEHLATALRTREMIGQAQGLLMHRFNCDSHQSFDLLKSASQNTNTKLRDVAAAMVTAHEQKSLDSALSKFGLYPAAAAVPAAEPEQSYPTQ